MGVAGGHGWQEVGVASEWNLWVWLECIGVVSGCCCKEVYRYPHNNYYFSLLHLYKLFFWQQRPYFFVHFLKAKLHQQIRCKVNNRTYITITENFTFT